MKRLFVLYLIVGVLLLTGCGKMNEEEIDALTLLKEQEPVKPEDQHPEVYGNFGHRFICGNCRKNIWRKNNYCPNCGRAVKWNG